jgi:nitrogen fixation/metabolism regulation signal transduction histidine kinase
MASANRLMKAYILIAAIPTIAIKFISFIMMMSSLN